MPNSLAENMQDCIVQVADWMRANRLKMNDDKTEAIPVGTPYRLNEISIQSIAFAETVIPFSSSAKNLGVFLDESLSMEIHISHLCRVLYFHLRRLSKIRPFLTVDAANKLAVSLVLSRLDYCNALLAGLPDERLARLQRVQNHAARIVLRKSRRDSATALLKILHWLPISLV